MVDLVCDMPQIGDVDYGGGIDAATLDKDDGGIDTSVNPDVIVFEVLDHFDGRDSPEASMYFTNKCKSTPPRLQRTESFSPVPDTRSVSAPVKRSSELLDAEEEGPSCDFTSVRALLTDKVLKRAQAEKQRIDTLGVFVPENAKEHVKRELAETDWMKAPSAFQTMLESAYTNGGSGPPCFSAEEIKTVWMQTLDSDVRAMLLTIILLVDQGWWEPYVTPHTVLTAVCSRMNESGLHTLPQKRMRAANERSGARVYTLKTTQAPVVQELIDWMRSKLPSVFAPPQPPPPPSTPPPSPLRWI